MKIKISEQSLIKNDICFLMNKIKYTLLAAHEGQNFDETFWGGHSFNLMSSIKTYHKIKKAVTFYFKICIEKWPSLLCIMTYLLDSLCDFEILHWITERTK